MEARGRFSQCGAEYSRTRQSLTSFVSGAHNKKIWKRDHKSSQGRGHRAYAARSIEDVGPSLLCSVAAGPAV